MAIASLAADWFADPSSMNCQCRIARPMRLGAAFRLTTARRPDSSREIRHRRRSTASLADWRSVRAVTLLAGSDCVNLKNRGRHCPDRIDARLVAPGTAEYPRSDPVGYGCPADPDFFRAVSCSACCCSFCCGCCCFCFVIWSSLCIGRVRHEMLGLPGAHRSAASDMPTCLERLGRGRRQLIEAGTPIAVGIDRPQSAPAVESASATT